MIADEQGQDRATDDSVSAGTAGVAAADTPQIGKKPRAAKAGDVHVSNALRSAYQATVQEDVPSEFLDLLGKLA